MLQKGTESTSFCQPVPEWVIKNREIVRGTRLWITGGLVVAPVLLSLVFMSWAPIAFIFPIALGGMIAMAITTASASACTRQLVTVDRIRIICWILFGCALDTQLWYGWHGWYSPIVWGVAMHTSFVLFFAAPLVIIFVSIGFRPSNTALLARCGKCEYLLKGLSEPRCPECGTAFDPAMVGEDGRYLGPDRN